MNLKVGDHLWMNEENKFVLNGKAQVGYMVDVLLVYDKSFTFRFYDINHTSTISSYSIDQISNHFDLYPRTPGYTTYLIKEIYINLNKLEKKIKTKCK